MKMSFYMTANERFIADPPTLPPQQLHRGIRCNSLLNLVNGVGFSWWADLNVALTLSWRTSALASAPGFLSELAHPSPGHSKAPSKTAQSPVQAIGADLAGRRKRE